MSPPVSVSIWDTDYFAFVRRRSRVKLLFLKLFKPTQATCCVQELLSPLHKTKHVVGTDTNGLLVSP